MRAFFSISGMRLVRALKQLGFNVVRVRGSHYLLAHSDGRRTVVPVHRGETIGRGLFAQILRDCEITREDLRKHL